jgi:hypothetical protein
MARELRLQIARYHRRPMPFPMMSVGHPPGI